MPRKIKSQDGNPYEVIRGMWEGAYVSHFVRLFRKKFGFSCLTTQDLEEALVEDSVVLADVLARLLRYLTGNKNILIANFDTFLRNLLIKEKASVPRFLENGTTWQELTPEEKLSILKWLIDHVHQEKEEEFADFLDENYCPDDLRGICAGQDAFNNVYWYLDDLRLYREASKKQSKKEWECVCLTLSDWHSFLKQFRKTTNVQEKELYTYLKFELFPLIELQLLDKSKNSYQDKEADNIYLIGKEREELEDMLEKKKFLECSNGLVKSLDVNGADNGCHDKHNGAISNVKCTSDGNGKIDFKIKTEEKTASEVNHCDGHVNIAENITSVSNSMSATKMDIKINVTNVCNNNTCGSSCPTTCTNTQAPINSVSSESSSACGNGSHCSSTGSTAIATSAPSSRDSIQDVSIQQPQSDNPSDSSSVTSNKENAPPSSGNSGTDIPPMSAMSNMVGSTSTPATTASVQPLPSNMVNKTSFPLETQYMQQQSQIFVFSTELANKAAESYLSGHFPSIIAFHCAQPGTKSFLEKYPLKVQQFNRQNPAAWLNTLASMKQGGRPMKGAMNQFPVGPGMNNRFPGPSPVAPGPCTGPCNVHGSNMCSGAPRGQGPWPNVISGNGMGPGMPTDMCGPSNSQPWTPQQFGHGVNPRFSGPMSQSMTLRPMGPSNSPVMGCANSMPQNIGGPPFQGQSMCPGSLQGPAGNTTLTGVKVPDENLTPQQRQHREEQLAMIRKMQQILFPEQQHMDQNQINMLGQQQNMGNVPGGMLQHGSQPRFGPSGEMCVHSSMEGCFSPHQPCMNDHEHSHPPSDMFMGPGMLGPGFHQQNFPNVSVAAQLEWQKLQHQFYEERRKKCGTVPLCHPTNATPGQPAMQHQQAQTPTQSQQTSQQILQHPPQPQTPLQQQTQQQSLNSPSPNMGLSPGTRMQGPPPPYHQTARRGLPSPHPASPNPSSLSLPSPRMVSGLSSPADPSRQFPHPTPPGSRLPHPSPGPTTPAGSNSLHTTPLNSPKPLNNSSGPNSNSGALIKTPTTPSNTSSTPSGTPTSSCVNALPSSGPSTPAGPCGSNRKQSSQCNDVQDSNSSTAVTSSSAEFTSSCAVSTPSTMQGDIFCHGAHQCSQSGSKQEHCVHPPALCHKEPSLMPVPSPQQIQYLNAFDGQELTIQKQPNTSIRELDIMSPASMPPSMVMSSGSHNHFQSPDGPSFPNTPGSCPALENSQDSLSGRYPASAPASMEGSMPRFTVPSPQVPGFDTSSRHSMPVAQSGDSPMPRFPGVHNMEMMRIPGPGLVPHSGMEENIRFSNHSQQGPMFGPAQGGTMDNMVRFQGSASEAIQRFRGPSPHNATPIDMLHSRFVGSSPHLPGSENIPSQSFPSPVHPLSSTGSPCIGGNFPENSVGHSHLHNLQKMTPPFESIVGNKVSSEVASPMGSCPSNPSLPNTGNANVAPYGAGSPLTPASQIGSSHRLAHFDPIASMAAMSESTGPLVTCVGNAQTHQNMITTNMNMTSIPVVSDPVGSNQTNMMNFNSGMPSIRGVLPNNVTNTVPNQHNQYIMSPHMPHSVSCVPQTANNSYINATMSVQPQSVQNIVTTSGFIAGAHVPNMNPHGPMPMQNQPTCCQESGTNTVSCSVTTNHPIMHSAVSTKSSNVNMCLSGPRQNHPQSFPGQPVVQRNAMPVGAAVSPSMMVRASGATGAPFNSTNIQVKASAPNTIQYLPARPQNATASNRPPSLEFLQRFAPPLTNLDNKVPTHNLQYFPNSRSSNTPTGHGGNTSMTSAACSVGPSMMTGQRPVNMMMGPMMRGANPAMSHAGNQMFPVGSAMPGPESQMFGRPQCPPGPQLNSQMMPMNAMATGQGVPMFPNKQMPLSMGGMAPDATQPLPPSMGQSFNYKQSPFYGPTTADPNYAVQFHNFQQQLYATNTRGSQMNSQNSLSGQGFFGPK